ncbi:MAG: DUF4382 domain-containing protein [Deltaproteobacteria bacterium]|nr:MAG: DUF4382 domain-containing protein [Deltaproteobacteria bacterium]
MPALFRRLDRRLIAVSLAAALAAALTGCGSGSGGVAVASNPGTGSVAVVVVDAASEDFEQIWVSVSKVELIGAQGHFTLFEGRRVFDLLSLRDDARLLSLGQEVPAGDWSKIRLHVEDVELIRVVPSDEAQNRVDCAAQHLDPEPGFVCDSITPKVGGNGKIDLNPRGPITVRAGELVFVQLDLDAQKSIHIVETGNERFIFRPVVFVDLFAVRPDRLVRIEGTIDEIDLAAQKLLLCDTHRVFRANAVQDGDARTRCIDVRVGPDTSIFDAEGQPATLADLAVGDEIAAIGRFHVDTGETLVFDALWIQQGGFDVGVAVSGEVLTGVSGGEFTISPDPDGPVTADPLTVHLLAGAKLFDRAGNAVAPADLVPGLRVRVFGVLAGTDPERLDASLVFVREPADLTRLRGTVTEAFDPADHTIVIRAVTSTSVGPRCVAIEPGDDVFRITDQGDQLTSERIAPAQLRVGETVDVFGHPASPCFDADTVISFGGGG